jgi:hypothetical protein
MLSGSSFLRESLVWVPAKFFLNLTWTSVLLVLFIEKRFDLTEPMVPVLHIAYFFFSQLLQRNSEQVLFRNQIWFHPTYLQTAQDWRLPRYVCLTTPRKKKKKVATWIWSKTYMRLCWKSNTHLPRRKLQKWKKTAKVHTWLSRKPSKTNNKVGVNIRDNCWFVQRCPVFGSSICRTLVPSPVLISLFPDYQKLWSGAQKNHRTWNQSSVQVR